MANPSYSSLLLFDKKGAKLRPAVEVIVASVDLG